MKRRRASVCTSYLGNDLTTRDCPRMYRHFSLLYILDSNCPQCQIFVSFVHVIKKKYTESAGMFFPLDGTIKKKWCFQFIYFCWEKNADLNLVFPNVAFTMSRLYLWQQQATCVCRFPRLFFLSPFW